MTSTVCIVGGCGHVGLPLGIALADGGANVTLVDTDVRRVTAVNEGKMPFLERGGEPVLKRVKQQGRLQAFTTGEVIAKSDVVIVTIGTPVDEFLDPGVRTFDRSIDKVLDQMRAGQLLILRSTVFPGVTERLQRRVTERNLQIDVAHCPERIAQGYAMEELGKLPQIIGGATPQATERAKKIFSLLGVRILEVQPVEAELAKLFANAHRYINFAISNQFYMIAQRFGADFHRVHEAVTADYPRLRGFAKAGLAGGPCLLKDTMQLAAFNHNAFPIGQAAMMVNEGLPSVIVEQVKTTFNLQNCTAAILGMAFKGDCDDPRDSLAYKMRKVLTLECREVICTDPYIEDPDFVSLEEALDRADILFIGATHAEYRHLSPSQPLIDVFDFIQSPAALKVHRPAA